MVKRSGRRRYVDTVAILVDSAVWPWRGRQWAHLASDVSFDELHTFAQQLGCRRLGFQGDHYDIDTEDRLRAIELGATPVDPRHLVASLRGAGLRRRHDKPAWQRIDFAGTGQMLTARNRLISFGDPGLLLSYAIAASASLDKASRSSLYADETRLVALFDYFGPPAAINLDPAVDVWAGEPRRDGERSVELFVDR